MQNNCNAIKIFVINIANYDLHNLLNIIWNLHRTHIFSFLSSLKFHQFYDLCLPTHAYTKLFHPTFITRMSFHSTFITLMSASPELATHAYKSFQFRITSATVGSMPDKNTNANDDKGSGFVCLPL